MSENHRPCPCLPKNVGRHEHGRMAKSEEKSSLPGALTGKMGSHRQAKLRGAPKNQAGKGHERAAVSCLRIVPVPVPAQKLGRHEHGRAAMSEKKSSVAGA